MSNYRDLDSKAVIQTIQKLQHRITDRFPNSGLLKVCAELLDVAHETREKSDRIARPNYILRIVVAAIIVFSLSALIYVLQDFDYGMGYTKIFEFVEISEAAINTIVLIGAAVFSLVTFETRLKRKRVLESLDELRALSHVIDMHQLTKDPSSFSFITTASSPQRELSQFETIRYLDYCSEMLSLIGKIAAMYAQRFSDPAVATAVNDIELLTTGLSRKIWQKLMVAESIYLSTDASKRHS